MRTFLVGLLSCFLILGPVYSVGAESGSATKSASKSASKPEAKKSGKEKVAQKKTGQKKAAQKKSAQKKVAGKSATAKQAKASGKNASGKDKSVGKKKSGKTQLSKHKSGNTKVSKLKSGKKLTAKQQDKKQKLAKLKAKERNSRMAKTSGGGARSAMAAAPGANRPLTPLRKVAAAGVLQMDYGDALGNPLAADGLDLRSAAVLVVDQKTGEALYAKNSDIETPIASITKLMTALVTLDADLPLGEEIQIGLQDVDHIKGTSSRLPLGARLTRGELLSLALIASENRAAAALSRAYPGGRESFVYAMNLKARQLGMLHTRFVDGTGLSSQNRSTAADLVRLVEAAHRYPTVRRISATGTYDVTVPGSKVVKIKKNGRVQRVTRQVERNVAYVNTNALTRNPEWEIGLSKTGYINEAGHCLVMQANIAQRKVIIVLLDSVGKMSRIGDANRIRRWLEDDQAGRFASRSQSQV